MGPMKIWYKDAIKNEFQYTKSSRKEKKLKNLEDNKTHKVIIAYVKGVTDCEFSL